MKSWMQRTMNWKQRLLRRRANMERWPLRPIWPAEARILSWMMKPGQPVVCMSLEPRDMNRAESTTSCPAVPADRGIPGSQNSIFPWKTGLWESLQVKTWWIFLTAWISKKMRKLAAHCFPKQSPMRRKKSKAWTLLPENSYWNMIR